MSRLRPTALAVLSLAALSATAAVAHAQGYGRGYGPDYRTGPDTVDERQHRQAERIERGYRDGSLSVREAEMLAHQQRHIAAYERQARADGRLDPYENARLRELQREASRDIARERHDMEVRRPWWRRW